MNFVTRSMTRGIAATLVLALVAGGTLTAAEAQSRRPDRPLTITKKRGAERGSGIQVLEGGNHIVAWGGFSANGYGYGRMGSEAARRGARNESVRARTAGLYGYGYDGLGGGFNADGGPVGGFNNPFYGNSYSSNVGYNGVPTAFAFGPGFANRHITDSEDGDEDISGPTPGELGFVSSGVSVDNDD